jgi:hypothetical protein
MAQAPEYSNQSGMPDASLPAHDCGHGDHMVRVGGVADSKQKTNSNHCQQVHHLNLP